MKLKGKSLTELIMEQCEKKKNKKKGNLNICIQLKG